jgi:DNA-binding response OmpR family regulator
MVCPGREPGPRLKSGCDLVITDVVMPDENALELLPKMKKAGSADHRHERAKYLHDRDQGVRARRLDYPPKPFDLRERV